MNSMCSSRIRQYRPIRIPRSSPRLSRVASQRTGSFSSEGRCSAATSVRLYVLIESGGTGGSDSLGGVDRDESVIAFMDVDADHEINDQGFHLTD